MITDLITPKTHPNHSTVGHHYAGYSFGYSRTEIYFCDSYDPRLGYWMTNVNDPADRRNVSERAIGGTFHEATERGTHWWVRSWDSRVEKAPLVRPKPGSSPAAQL